jgi:ATP-dependent helicase HepA
VESFPGLPAEGFTITCDRRRALLHEDVQFLTWDHPLATGAIDLLLGSEKGNSAMVEDESQAGLEAIYALECIAPPALHIDRFLPPTPVRVFGKGADLEAMLADSRRRAEAQVPEIVAEARGSMASQLTAEIDRLRELQRINPSVRDEEIAALVAEQRALDEHLRRARLRLDCVKLSVVEE